VVTNSSDGENTGHIGYTRTRGTFHVGSACIAGRQHEEDFFLAGVILGRSRAAQGAERDHMNSLQEPKDAPGRDNYDLVLFEDETEARPAWLACNPNKLNFLPAAYNELLAL
jgi:hypothetical protein